MSMASQVHTSSSSPATATEDDIRGLLVGLYRDKNVRRGLLVVHAQPRWDGPTAISVEDLMVPVHCCRTVLQLRDVIRHRNDPDTPWRVVLTDLRDDDIPHGVKEHFKPVGRSLELDPTRTLLGLFSAARTGGRVPRNRQDIRGLVALLSPHRASLEPTSTPVLTADHLYAEVTRHVLGLAENTRLADLLAWSATPEATESWDHVADELSEPTRQSLLTWICRGLTLTGSSIRALWSARGPGALLPAGVVAETLGQGASSTDGRNLAVPRALFRKHAGQPQDEETLRDWGRGAATAIRSMLDHGQPVTAALAEASQLLDHVDDTSDSPLLAASTILPGGFQRRLDRFVRTLAPVLAGGDDRPALRALEDMRQHVDAGRAYSGDIDTAAALLRLLRWHHTAADHAEESMRTATIDQAMREYAAELSWVDRAVNTAWRGFSADPKPDARHSTVDPDALTRDVTNRVLDTRKRIDRSFGALAASRLADGASAGSALLVEDVIGKVIEPLHKSGPVSGEERKRRPLLVLVVDGLSMAAAHGLSEDLRNRHGTVWQQLDLSARGLHVAATTLPSVTTYSRTSLLTGTLMAGGQTEETQGFAAALPGARLFHKAALDSGIADQVRQTIYDTTHTPVVGAVLNTVDDALDRSDPIAATWTTQRITHMDKLLEYARAVGRDVVIVSDHGHVVERSQIPKADADTAVSARWRPSDGPPADDSEREVSGTRVLSPGGSAILAVDEDLRYTGKKAGYHGGAAPAEVCAPISVLVQSLDGLDEDSLFPAALPMSDPWPAWWDLSAPEPASQGAVTPGATQPERPTPPPTSTPSELQSTLFDDPEPPPSPKATSRTSDLYTSLARNRQFRDQVEAHNVGLEPREFADALRAIAHNNGRMPMAGLAERVGLNAIRLRGTLTRMQKVVNIDGMPVLEIDGNDVVFSPELLREQYGLP